MKASALVQEGETPPEDPVTLLSELEAMAGELKRLIAQINRTNLATQLSAGETLTDALARRDILSLRQTVLRQVADVAGERQQRYGLAEIGSCRRSMRIRRGSRIAAMVRPARWL